MHLARNVIFCVLVGALGKASADEGFEAVTPYRPSVSSPAELSAPGQLEIELGGLRQRNRDQTRTSVPYLVKLAFDSQWGMLLGGEAHVWQRDASGREQGAGDTSLTLKRALTLDSASALGAELAVKLPTAKEPIGSGQRDWSLNTIYSRDFGPLHLDANANAMRPGQVDPGTGRTQYGASASFSTAISSRWGANWEWSGTRRSGVPSGSQWLVALTFSPTHLLTIDLGMARAARPGPATTQWFSGLVMPLAKLW